MEDAPGTVGEQYGCKVGAVQGYRRGSTEEGRNMKITIDGEPKEIAALVVEIQERQENVKDWDIAILSDDKQRPKECCFDRPYTSH